MFNEYLNKNCFVCVSFGGMQSAPVFYYGQISAVTNDFVTLQNVSICANGMMLGRRQEMKMGKTTINKNYIIFISEEK